MGPRLPPNDMANDAPVAPKIVESRRESQVGLSSGKRHTTKEVHRRLQAQTMEATKMTVTVHYRHAVTDASVDSSRPMGASGGHCARPAVASQAELTQRLANGCHGTHPQTQR